MTRPIWDRRPPTPTPRLHMDTPRSEHVFAWSLTNEGDDFDTEDRPFYEGRSLFRYPSLSMPSGIGGSMGDDSGWPYFTGTVTIFDLWCSRGDVEIHMLGHSPRTFSGPWLTNRRRRSPSTRVPYRPIVIPIRAPFDLRLGRHLHPDGWHPMRIALRVFF